MANHTSQTEVETDGGTIPWHTDDDRQLSSDLENILRLGPYEKEIIEPSGLVEPKSETRAPCMFATDGVRGETGPPAFLHGNDFNYQNSPGSVYTHPTSNEVPWNQPQHPGSWRPDNSLSSTDLEMDREPSMTPFPQILSPGMPQDTKMPVLESPLMENMMKYPYEDKLMRYDGQPGLSDYTNPQHLMWQQNIQQGSMPPTPGSVAVAAGEETMEDEDVTYTIEVDEYGEGPLHTLSVMKDKVSLAKNIDILLKCGVVMSCINLQNKLKQTPLFLAVMEGNLCYIAWLLDNGADPNIQGTLYVDRYEYIWRSPLHLAAMKGDEWIYILRLLLKKIDHVDINICSHGDKLSALHLALKHHSPPVLSCRHIILELLKSDVDITIRDQSNSKTPLMLAMETRDLKLVEDFINTFSAEQRRVMVQEQTRSGDTCLHIAAGLSRISKQDKLKLLRLLVINGANGNIHNNARELPRDLAREEWDCIRRT